MFLIYNISIIHAQAEHGFPDLQPNPAALEFARNGQKDILSWEDIAVMALWASGLPAGRDGTLNDPSHLTLLRQAVFELHGPGVLPSDPRTRGEFILNFMHQRFLKTYSEQQTRLDTLLSNGTYNCVSSAVLYTILASAAGLRAEGVMTRDHAFAAVLAGTESVDVETTNPYGFDPGTKREFQDRFGRITGFAYVPPGNYRERSSLSQMELVSLILSNRIAVLESRSRYAEAVSLALDREALLSQRQHPADSPFFSDPRKDVMDRLFNFGAALVGAGREKEALDWAVYAGERFQDNERWQEFVHTAMNNLLVKLIRQNRISEARDELDVNAYRLTPRNYDLLNAMVSDAELVRLSQAAGGEIEVQAAIDVIGQALSRSLVSPARAEELRTFVILREAERLGRDKGPPAAIAYTEQAVSRYGSNSQLQNALSVFRANRIADLHNRFAELFNKGNYEEALAAVREALEEFPGNRRLTEDLVLAEQALRQQQNRQ
ncbi:hypothetical protein LJC14_01940 [Treponema sp. OttesenSCG-928-L16]|nr:hypothetical protein [Treponema sp. OttesenSCG-928-L16]